MIGRKKGFEIAFLLEIIGIGRNLFAPHDNPLTRQGNVLRSGLNVFDALHSLISS